MNVFIQCGILAYLNRELYSYYEAIQHPEVKDKHIAIHTSSLALVHTLSDVTKMLNLVI